MKVELNRFTYGYFRVMEFLAWSMAIRLVVNFNDVFGVPIMISIIAGLELFRILMERRGMKAAIVESQEVADLEAALQLLGRFDPCKKPEHQGKRDTECYYCISDVAKEYIKRSINKKEKSK